MSETPKDNLAARCKAYLADGPPRHMTNFVPNSLTAVIIAHGVKDLQLEPELREIGNIVLLESKKFDSYTDEAIRDYMKLGAQLVSEVLSRPTG